MAEIAETVTAGFEEFEVWICVETDREKFPELVTLHDGYSFKILGKLLEESEPGSTITDEVVCSVARSAESGENLMKILLDTRGPEVTITEAVVEAAAANFQSEGSIMKLLLDRLGQEVTVTEAVVEAAAANSKSGEAIMKLLLDRRGPEVTVTDVLERAVQMTGGEECKESSAEAGNELETLSPKACLPNSTLLNCMYIPAWE
jgi:hypothetical protein